MFGLRFGGNEPEKQGAGAKDRRIKDRRKRREALYGEDRRTEKRRKK